MSELGSAYDSMIRQMAEAALNEDTEGLSFNNLPAFNPEASSGFPRIKGGARGAGRIINELSRREGKTASTEAAKKKLAVKIELPEPEEDTEAAAAAAAAAAAVMAVEALRIIDKYEAEESEPEIKGNENWGSW